jgi:hypothetical protein
VTDLKDFRGPCLHMIEGYGDSESTFDDWNDCISSIRVV